MRGARYGGLDGPSAARQVRHLSAMQDVTPEGGWLMVRPLGGTQQEVLRSLRNHGYWHYSRCGWYWDTLGNTEKVLDSLVRRGLVTKDGDGFYRPVEGGV